MVDMIVSRLQLKETLGRVFSWFGGGPGAAGNPTAGPADPAAAIPGDEPDDDPDGPSGPGGPAQP